MRGERENDRSFQPIAFTGRDRDRKEREDEREGEGVDTRIKFRGATRQSAGPASLRESSTKNRFSRATVDLAVHRREEAGPKASPNGWIDRRTIDRAEKVQRA